MIGNDNISLIEKEIATLRKRLVEYSSTCTEFSDPNLVQISEELDQKIVALMKSKTNKK